LKSPNPRYLPLQILFLCLKILLIRHIPLLLTHHPWILSLILPTHYFDLIISDMNLINFAVEHAETPKADISGAQMLSMIVTKIMFSFFLLQSILMQYQAYWGS
jgi:hypothetical protein